MILQELRLHDHTNPDACLIISSKDTPIRLLNSIGELLQLVRGDLAQVNVLGLLVQRREVCSAHWVDVDCIVYCALAQWRCARGVEAENLQLV